MLGRVEGVLESWDKSTRIILSTIGVSVMHGVASEDGRDGTLGGLAERSMLPICLGVLYVCVASVGSPSLCRCGMGGGTAGKTRDHDKRPAVRLPVQCPGVPGSQRRPEGINDDQKESMTTRRSQ